jgi:hypothetical protein
LARKANEIPNTAPSWLPGDDYYTNFHEGDPFLKVSEGYARLPGAGYEALHPDVEGLDPEDYPEIHKMAILADVAPYSREYNTFRQRVGKQAQGSTELEIEYEKILKRVKQTRSFRPAETKTLRARQTEVPSTLRPHAIMALLVRISGWQRNHRSLIRNACSLALFRYGKLEWSLHSAETKTLRARQPKPHP